MKWLIPFVLVAIAAPSAPGIADPEDIDLPGLVAQRSIRHARNLLKTYSPDRYYILHLGLSTTVLESAIRHMMPARLRNRYMESMPIQQIRFVAELDAPNRQAFFRRFLPSKKRLGGRTLVLHRILWAGHSMQAFLPVLDEYLAAHRPELTYKTHFIVNRISEDLGRPRGNKTIEDLIIGEHAIHNLNDNHQDDPTMITYFSERQPFYAVDYPLLPTRRQPINPQHKRLDRAMAPFVKAAFRTPKQKESLARILENIEQQLNNATCDGSFLPKT